MVRTGFVKEKNGAKLRVCFGRPQACEGCKGCSKSFLPTKELLTVFGEADVGDVVDVEIPEGHHLLATLLAYALPLCLFIAGLVLGDRMNCNEGLTIAFSISGLAFGYLLSCGAEKLLRTKPEWQPKVVHVCCADAQERKQDNE